MRVTERGIGLGPLVFSPGAVFAASALLYFGSDPVLSACLLAAAVHEGGHILCCLLLGVRVHRLRVTLLGAVLDTDARCESGGEEVLVALAGPLANLASVPLTLPCWELFAGASLLLGMFNLLPVSPLDGSRVLHGALSLRGDLSRAEELVHRVSRSAGAVLTAVGIALAALGNPSLLVLAIWLLMQERRR